MNEVWIVVLNWNGRDDTLELLGSLRAAVTSSATVLVVDNGSTDGSLEAVQQLYPEVETLQNGYNAGYAAGNNAGIELARRRGAEVIVVLNNDTTVELDFLAPLVALARSGAVAVSPDIRYYSDRSQSWFFGARVNHRSGTVEHVPHELQAPRTGQAPTELLTGCCLAASESTWKAVGGFDERYFLIFEDSDWSMRAKAAGVSLVLEPASVVHHKVSRSFQGPVSGLGMYYFCRNGVRFARTWLGWGAVLRFAAGGVLRPGLSALRRRAPGSGRMLTFRICGLAAGAFGPGGRAGRIARLATRGPSTSP